MKNKIADLRKCIARVAHVGDHHLKMGFFMVYAENDVARFAALNKARNRRTVVAIKRAVDSAALRSRIDAANRLYHVEHNAYPRDTRRATS